MHKKITVSSEPKIIGVNNGISQIELDRKDLLKQGGRYYEFYNHFDNFTYWELQKNQRK